MSQGVRRVFLLAAGVSLVAAAAVGAGAVGSLGAKPPTQPVIAVVNLADVVKGLDERTVKDATLNAKKTELIAGVEKLRKEVESLKTSIEAAPDSADKVELAKRFRRQSSLLEVEGDMAQKELDRLYGSMLREMYVKVAESSKRLAQKNGYTMVLSSDEMVSIPPGNAAQVDQAISFKRMLYVEGGHDVTSELVTLMNNDFAAAGGKRVNPPSTPPAPAGTPALQPGGTNK